MKARHILWIGPVFFLLASGQVFAQSAMDARVQKLEETIQVLQRRVASLEEQLRGHFVPASAAPAAPDKANWRKLQKGMSEGDVEKLLGSPSKVDVFGSFSVWQYYGPSPGKVQFTEDHKVDGWNEQ